MNIGVILAGGFGSRMKMEKPKQFLEICGKPAILYPLETFNASKHIDKILCVCAPEWVDRLEQIIRENKINKVTQIVPGGRKRTDSSWNALCALKEACTADDDIVLIHDAARLLVSDEIIEANIKKVRQYGCCETVIPVTNTIVVSKDGFCADTTPDRNYLYSVQTPQSFLFGKIYRAYEQFINESETAIPQNAFTDDAGLASFYGSKVFFVQGSKKNIKLTTQEDIPVLESFIHQL
jgi:2-C-methyl-D-erythritol 4-phosphate cytidylyltransferase